MKSDDLQQAIYTRLTEESELELDFVLNTYLNRSTPEGSVTPLLSTAYIPLAAIFTDVPQADDSELETMFPFITIGGDTINPFDSKDDLGGSAIVQIDVWDRASSMLRLKTITDAVDARLRRQPLAISGVTHITTELDSCVFSRDPDGKTKRALILYRVLWIA
jgi:hypothetical protein